jgi:hypothetical protein
LQRGNGCNSSKLKLEGAMVERLMRWEDDSSQGEICQL